MPPSLSVLLQTLRTHQIYGANTEVGKTIFSTTLANTIRKVYPHHLISYLKPVSTGDVNDADERHIRTYSPFTKYSTLFQYRLPESPHSAALVSGLPIPSDASLIQGITKHANKTSNSGTGWLFIETAGGVHSPGPSGTTQAELYKPLRLPALLVGDSKLGGISSTISSYETLKMRGYDVEAVLLFREGRYKNYEYLRDYFAKEHGVKIATIEAPPEKQATPGEDFEAMFNFYQKQVADESLKEIVSYLDSRHNQRIVRLSELPRKAHEKIWFPFTQQTLLPASRITAIDSAHGSHFQVFAKGGAEDTRGNLLHASFDGSASWWTQGLGHTNTRLTMAAAYAAGRYGHVMFAEAVHEPAVQLAETMLQSTEEANADSRVSRVFFTDNGSSGCEVAVKMALRAARTRYGWSPQENIEIIGLKGSYHGDTIGVMDCADPNPYNEKVEWYRGRGFWFDYPTVLYKEGGWTIESPKSWEGPETKKVFGSLEEVFDLLGRERVGQAEKYAEYIRKTLEAKVAKGHKFGALVMEPVVLGAGGMKFVDPLFQRTLVNVIRSSPIFCPTPPNPNPTTWTGLPVFFDEVFTGLYRLGPFTPSSFLGVAPDIVVNAKLLTGGAVPMCTTMASQEVFESFLSDDKADALLHGHSYTAYPVGCQVAVEAVKELKRMDREDDWAPFKQDWSSSTTYSVSSSTSESTPKPWSMWPQSFLHSLPGHYVTGAWSLGSVLAIKIHDANSSGGYKSTAALDTHKRLLQVTHGWNIHNRILGNVIYLIASQTTTAEEIRELCERVKECL